VFRLEKLKEIAFGNVKEVLAPWARSRAPPDAARDDVGFRCVKTLP
jgi:formylglycine-generating enzyme required for sulfatase activity